MNSEKNEKGQLKQSSKESRKKKFPASGFIIVLLITSIAILIVEQVTPYSTTVTIKIDVHETKIYLIYVAFAFIGVAFHLMNQYRKLREQDGFDWEEYRFDYFFRALQAGVYVIIVGTFVDPSNTSMVTALFVGMYIRRVEAVFEDLGDRFGDTLRGILGTMVQRLSPTEKRQKRQEIQNQFLTLKKNYEQLKAKLDDPDRQKLENELLKIQTLIQKGKVEAAESKLLSLDFQIKDVQIKLKN